MNNNNMNLVNLTIDNINLLVKKNTTIIQACLVLKKQQNNNTDEKEIAIPRFCFHQELEIAGNCRMCLVELVNSPKPVVACAMQVNDKMIIKTDTVLVKKAREGVLEFFLINHPLDCPVCDQGGECDLQDQVDVFGIDKSRFNEYKRAISYKSCSPFIKMVMTRCIHCTRCIRFLTEIAGVYNFCLVGRGNQMEVGQFVFKNLKSELSGNIVDLCPVGALTGKSSAFKLRFWELTKKETVDVIDNIGADIRVDLRGTEILRILPRLNKDVNNNWITDTTRYAFDALIVQRFIQPYFREDVKYDNKDNILFKTNWADILELYWKYTYVNQFILKKKINYSFLSGTFSDSITNISIKNLSNSLGSSFIESKIENNKFNNVDFRQYYITNWNRIDFNNTDIFIFLGLNLRLEAPLLNVKLRKLKKKKKILIFSFSNTANLLYYVKHVSISSKNFIKFLEGKHYLSNFLVNNKSKSYFLLGSSLLRRSDAQAYIYSLEYFINNQFPNASFGIIQNYIGRVTSAEIGLVPGISYYNNNNSLQFNNFNNLFKKPINNLFIFAADDYKKLNLHKYNSFNIFIGPQTENYIDNVHMVLPSTNHFEKTTSYLNIEGISRFSQTVIKLLENVQEDWRITFLIFLKICKSENLIKYFDNNFFVNNYYFINYYFFNKKNDWNKELKFFFFNNTVINNLKIKLKNLHILNLKKRYGSVLGNQKIFYLLKFVYFYNKNILDFDLSDLSYYIKKEYYSLVDSLYIHEVLRICDSWLVITLQDTIIRFFKDAYLTWKIFRKFFLIFTNKYVRAFFNGYRWDKYEVLFSWHINKSYSCNLFYKKHMFTFFKLFFFKKNNLLSYFLNNKSFISKDITRNVNSDIKIFSNKIVQYSNNYLDNFILNGFIFINHFKLIFSILNKNVYDIKLNQFNIFILNNYLSKFILIFIFNLFKYNTKYININNNFININKYSIYNVLNNLRKLFINNFLKDFRYPNIKGSVLFYTDNIDNTLLLQLQTYSRLFLLENQYYILNNNSSFILKNKIYNKFYINNYPFVSYIDNYYKTNVISSLSPRMRAAASRYKYKILFSNYL